MNTDRNTVSRCLASRQPPVVANLVAYWASRRRLAWSASHFCNRVKGKVTAARMRTRERAALDEKRGATQRGATDSGPHKYGLVEG
jgi:hypothetical protein